MSAIGDAISKAAEGLGDIVEGAAKTIGGALFLNPDMLKDGVNTAVKGATGVVEGATLPAARAMDTMLGTDMEGFIQNVGNRVEKSVDQVMDGAGRVLSGDMGGFVEMARGGLTVASMGTPMGWVGIAGMEAARGAVGMETTTGADAK